MLYEHKEEADSRQLAFGCAGRQSSLQRWIAGPRERHIGDFAHMKEEKAHFVHSGRIGVTWKSAIQNGVLAYFVVCRWHASKSLESNQPKTLAVSRSALGTQGLGEGVVLGKLEVHASPLDQQFYTLSVGTVARMTWTGANAA